MIRFACPGCGQIQQAADALAGKAVKCCQCGRFVPMPAPAEYQTAAAGPAAATRSSPATDSRSWSAPSERIELAESPPLELLPSLPDWPQIILSFGKRRKHSRLGIASSCVALFAIGVTAIARGLSSIRLSMLSISFCLIGVALAFVALIAQRHRKHHFSWLGLIANLLFLILAILCYRGH